MGGEDVLLAWLSRQQHGRGLAGPGDDVAVLGRGRSARALTVDQQIAEVHVPEDLDAVVWARRLLAVNLSDLAAVGARPLAALLTLAVPEDFPCRRFLRAAIAACRRIGVPLIGGDIAGSPHAVTTLTAIGDRPEGGKWVARSGARPGDRLWLGRAAGWSAIGQRLVARGGRLASNRVRLPDSLGLDRSLAAAARRALRIHLQPEPQLTLGQWLGSQSRGAAIDVSDGLARDLHRLCRASEVGAIVERSMLPLERTMTELAEMLGESALDLVLGGGEDYCLLFALPPRSSPPERLGARVIGRITAGRDLWLADGGEHVRLAPTGWDHLA